MNGITMPSGESMWRVLAIGLIAALVAVLAFGQADAAKRGVKVLKSTKTVIEEDFVGAGGDNVTVAKCPRGWQVTGGGYDFVSDDHPVKVNYDGPLIRTDNLVAEDSGRAPSGRAWRIQVSNPGGGGYDYAVGAICSKTVKVD